MSPNVIDTICFMLHFFHHQHKAQGSNNTDDNNNKKKSGSSSNEYKHYISSYICADALHAVYFVLGHLSVFISHCLTFRVFVFPTFPRFPPIQRLQTRDVERGLKGGYMRRDCYQCWLNGRHTQGTHTQHSLT